MVIFSFGHYLNHHKGKNKHKPTNYRNQSSEPNCVLLCFFQIASALTSIYLNKGTHLHPSVSLPDDIGRDSVGKEANKKELVHSFRYSSLDIKNKATLNT